MDGPAVLEEIRLPSFKSLRSATVPIRDLTLLVGRNGSGKSNVLDGISVLSRLAAGGDIRDQLDGGPDGPAVRGGAEGCAPIGVDRFELGCTVGTPGARIHLDVVVGVRPMVQIVSERLQVEPRSPRSAPRVLLEGGPADPASLELAARWQGRRRGGPTAVTFRATQLLTSQVAMRVPVTTQAARDVHEAAEAVLRGLRGVFLLDPVPAAMRQYVPAGDNRLRRRADNLSAVVGRLMAEPGVYDRLLEVMRTLSESRLEALATEASPLGDLMLVQREIVGDREAIVPARLMSDGTLRVLAIVAAVLETTVEPPSSSSGVDGVTKTLVVEEIENGLHPSQSAAIIRRVIEESRPRASRTLATTHSPAMLDALDGSHHDGVLICVRDERGWTRLHPLTELPNYFNVVARGTLGDAATADRLRPRTATRTPAELIEELFGDG